MQDFRFQLAFSMDNDAFIENDYNETVSILRKIADDIEASGKVPTLFRTVYDSNGNIVGQYAAKHKDYK